MTEPFSTPDPGAAARTGSPLDEDNHADRYDCGSQLWTWCDECRGLRLGYISHASGSDHGPRLGRTPAEVDAEWGPLTFSPDEKQGAYVEYGRAFWTDNGERLFVDDERWETFEEAAEFTRLRWSGHAYDVVVKRTVTAWEALP